MLGTGPPTSPTTWYSIPRRPDPSAQMAALARPALSPRLRRDRHLADHRAPAQHARLLSGVVRLRLVQHAAVVQDPEVARPPAVRVDELRPYDRSIQLLDQLPSRLERHALHAPGMIAEEQAFAPGLGMDAHDRVCYRRLGLLLRLAHRVVAVPPRAREIQGMDRAQRRQPLLHSLVEVVVGGVHAGKTGLAALARHPVGIEQSCLAGAARP